MTSETKIQHSILSDHARHILSTGYDAYRKSYPFPHVIIDDFFQPDVAKQMFTYAKSLMTSDSCDHKAFLHAKNKFIYSDVSKYPAHIQNIIDGLVNTEMVNDIHKLTGIRDLISGEKDLRNCGFEKLVTGGYENMHTDYNILEHKNLGLLDRRVTLVVFLNKDWCDRNQSGVWLANKSSRTWEKGVPPVFNRAIIFNSSNESVYGHPFPWKSLQPGQTWNAFKIAYYTHNSCPDDSDSPVCFEGDNKRGTTYYSNANFKPPISLYVQ